MISEQQCVESANYLTSIGQDNTQCFHNLIVLAQKLKALVCCGNKDTQAICMDIYNYDCQSDMDKAMLAYALAYASAYSHMSKAFLQKAINLSDELIKKNAELGYDESSVLASAVLLLEKSRIPVVLKHVYISCARVMADRCVQNIKELSQDGRLFLLGALNALIEARRVYKW